jgi:glycosyltransferase involved in cell wall biosynthesis
MQATMAWRVTYPLRSAFRTKKRLVRYSRGTTAHRELELAFVRRIVQATETLCPDAGTGSPQEVDEALTAFEAALTSSRAPDQAKAWLSLVSADGCFPDERSVEHMARVLRLEGSTGLLKELALRLATGIEQGTATRAVLDVRHDQVVVDVSHTSIATDLHTGIQRVVRETVGRWIDQNRPMELIRFEPEPPAARLLSVDELQRFRSWRRYVRPSTVKELVRPVLEGHPTAYRLARSLHTAGTSALTGSGRGSTEILVPWQCDLVVPELPFEPERSSAYRGLATASVLRSLSLVGYDLIPILASEKVAAPKVTTDFAGYLSLVKHADRVSTISRTSRESFKGFAEMTAAEGLRAPLIAAHELPTEIPPLDERAVEAASTPLGVGSRSVVLVVGSHEPRKNHLAVLEAAERLWSQNHMSFELLFVGWSGWLSEEFDELVAKLVSRGRPITVRKRCAEEELWAAYRLARFTVFPSLLEGYGLPIAESLASGTPVITSNYGSMAEAAEKGGCVLVDPRNVEELVRAMSLLLNDDDVLNKLREEALSIDTGTWESYANELWDFLTGAGREERLPQA